MSKENYAVVSDRNNNVIEYQIMNGEETVKTICSQGVQL